MKVIISRILPRLIMNSSQSAFLTCATAGDDPFDVLLSFFFVFVVAADWVGWAGI